MEFARNVCMLDGADSTEVDEAAPHKVIYKLRDLLGVDDLGGTMRLGRYECELVARHAKRAKSTAPTSSTSAIVIASSSTAFTRARCARKGMRISGRSRDGKFVEIAELACHPWFIAVQFHPEFQSRPLKPHPLFASFVGAAHRQKLAASGNTLDATSLA